MAADPNPEHRPPESLSSDRPTEPPVGLDPDEVARKTFETAFRGYEPGQVQAYLLTLAAELRRTREQVFDLELRLSQAERAAEQAATIDDERLTAALGDEVATILESARSAAAKMRAQAEVEAAELVRAGEEQATRVRREADEVLGKRTEEARQAAKAIEEEAEKLRAQATVDAAAEVEAGKAAGREMIAEAQVVRERILKDLARRRRQARQQIEQLRAGRERLLDAYRVVRETMEEATQELEISLPAAKAAAETAGRSLPDEDDDLSIEQLEGMLDAARDAGLIEARSPAATDDLEPEVADATVAEATVVEATADADDETDEGEPADEGEAETAPAVYDVEADEAEETVEVATDTATEAAEATPAAVPARAGGRRTKAERIVADEPAPPPVEGRRSSSVRVFRRDGDAVDEAEEETTVAAGAPAPSDAPADDDVVVEVVEEIVEVDELPDGEAVVVVEVVEEVIEVDHKSSDASEPAATSAEGEVITGLFARIRADHAEPTGPDTTATSPAEGKASGKANGNGHGKNGNGRTKSRKGRSGTSRSKASSNEQPKAEPSKAEAPATSEPTEPAPTATDDTAADSPQERRDRALAGPSRGLGRALKRVVADEQNEVLDVVRREKKNAELDDVLPEASEHALRYAAAAKSELGDAAYAGATFADEGSAERPDVDDLAAELSLAIVNQLRGGFARAVAATPDDREALLDSLRALYRETKGQRVDECVRHYAGEAFNRGVRAASTSGLDVRMLVDAGTKPSLG